MTKKNYHKINLRCKNSMCKIYIVVTGEIIEEFKGFGFPHSRYEINCPNCKKYITAVNMADPNMGMENIKIQEEK